MDIRRLLMTGILCRIPNSVQMTIKEKELRLNNQFVVLRDESSDDEGQAPAHIQPNLQKRGTNSCGKLQPIDNNSIQVQNCKTTKPAKQPNKQASTTLEMHNQQVQSIEVEGIDIGKQMSPMVM